MIRRLAIFAAAFAAITAAAPARAGSSLTIEGFGGIQSFRRPAASQTGVSDFVRDASGMVGGSALARLEGFGLGVGVDKTLNSGGPEPWAGFIMAGFLVDPLPSLRLELLGEVGRWGNSSFGDIFSSDKGQMFLGVRPGVSFRLWPSPIRIGITGIVRWPTSGGEFGNPDYGAVGRVGFELG
ncbi:hypothetical protein [Anaeromyxobacter paludicola]|uniref:Uncharacterized protein n=1 Tax=Anaeromyxobacter paludicola TaxID=2918171 RepID=A0ABM7XF33_9BACT|nr:hypothetical protein [Anaeromyxobacter paludicola]BDG10485.1 hypothetical protein AMPC_35980 [Anaeromyxobacter paludicola]